MEDCLTIRISEARSCTRTVDPRHRWMSFGVVLSQPFILDDPATDSLRVVERADAEHVIICNQWRTPVMPAPAFYYFKVRMVVTSGAFPLEPDVTTFCANYSARGRTIVYRGQRFFLEGVSQAIFQDFSGSEKPTPGIPSPLPAESAPQPA